MIRLSLAIAAAAALSGGCVLHNHGAAYIQTVPDGAEVVNLDDDTVLGITPVKVWWRETGVERKFINVRLQKPGYRDKTTSFWVSLRHKSKSSALQEPQFVEVKLDETSN